jgi:hypothetical protein
MHGVSMTLSGLLTWSAASAGSVQRSTGVPVQHRLCEYPWQLRTRPANGVQGINGDDRLLFGTEADGTVLA